MILAAKTVLLQPAKREQGDRIDDQGRNG